MLETRIVADALQIGPHFSLSFQRTLRIPDDGHVYPLPPGLGSFPIRRVEDYRDRVPAAWRAHAGVFIPMYQREALWLAFESPEWRAQAVKIAIGKVNVVTGKAWAQPLSADPQDYVVCPAQPWLDGINTGHGTIRQFVAMPLGMGYTVEGQLTGEEVHGGIQVIVYEPRAGRFPENAPRERVYRNCASITLSCQASPGEMGLGAGGKMKQAIYPDPHGLGTWDPENYGRVYVHIVNSMMYREITGEEPPPTPVTARSYADHGLPWFSLYDEHKGDLAPADALKRVKPIKELDALKGFGPQQDDGAVGVKAVVKLGGDPGVVGDGDW